MSLAAPRISSLLFLFLLTHFTGIVYCRTLLCSSNEDKLHAVFLYRMSKSVGTVAGAMEKIYFIHEIRSLPTRATFLRQNVPVKLLSRPKEIT